MTLAEDLPRQLVRVTELRCALEGMRGMPQVNVEFGIQQMNSSIEAAIIAMGDGDVVGMVRAYAALKDFK